MDIQWYPGHMTKTRRMMEENISLVDIVIELVDARIPYSSKNPDMDDIAKNKHRILLFNKADLADENASALWSDYFQQQGYQVILGNSLTGKGLQKITEVSTELMKEKIEKQKARGRISVPIRAMIVGIPNVGKSTFINQYVGKAAAKTGDRPGVTRGKQWIKVKKNFELLDTPGILWPKFEDMEVGQKLAFTGAVNDQILDIQTLAVEFIALLLKIAPDVFQARYGLVLSGEETAVEILEKIGQARGFKLKGNQTDLERTAKILFDEYRGGKLGRLTLELPQDIAQRNEKSRQAKKEKEIRDRQRKLAYQQKQKKKNT